ncbi:MAG TPA: hypothetical protein VKS82_13050 [Streptosporangiaceae bacterium]|nr:hypothetical protein [Streptosporangiaceae bacterium]
MHRARVSVGLCGSLVAGALLGVAGVTAALAGPGHGATPVRAAAPVRDLAAGHPVVFVGIAGLLWSDISATATPALWRLAGAGSDGNLVVHAVQALTCPADGWLTLNAGARAMAPRPASGRCPGLPSVVPGAGGPAEVPAMRSLVAYNQQFHYNPNWGLLAGAAGPGNCATAIGPGAALALANRAGRVGGYLPATPASLRNGASFSQCPLTVVDLGTVPASHGRQAAVRADDAAVGRIRSELPPGATLVVAALADGVTAHLHPIIVDGPGFGSGLLGSAATRQPGLVTLTDLTPTLLRWNGVPVPSDAIGSQLTRADRGSLGPAVRGLIGQDTAAQVYRGTFGWFFAVYGVADALVMAGIGLLLRGGQPERRRRRAQLWRVAAVFACAVPVGSFLASVVPWWLLSHPAVWLYGLTAAWALAAGAVALAGPWRRDPLGPLGVVSFLTVAVIAVDIATGSRLQLGTPFGLSVVVAGRYYGIGNNAIVIYAAAGLLAAGWVGMLMLRRGQGSVRAALAATAVVALVVVAVAGWPGFGAKVGGTFAMVPGFLIIMMGVAGVRMTTRRVAVAIVCGAAVVVLFALVNYLAPSTGQSDIGGFFGQVLHGGAGGTLSRKIGSNVGSLTTSYYALIVPPVVVLAGLMLLRPSWFAIKTLPRAWANRPLLRVILAAIWLVAVLCWFAEDSGVTVVASGLPFTLPLAIGAAAAACTGTRTPGDAVAAHPERQAIL